MKHMLRLDKKDVTMEVLKILKEEQSSGEAIASKLGVSRTSVWKAVMKLKNLGYGIEAKKRVGYKLISFPDFSPYEVMEACFSMAEFVKELHYYTETDSTNQRAKEEGINLLVIAEKQSAGRGRLGRKWFSDEGGLYFSIALSPSLPVSDVPKLTLTTGVAVCEALSFVNARLKWPNDVLVNGKKVCGILSEIGGEVDSTLVTVGIGVNVNNKIPDELKEKAISLREIVGKDLNRTEILKKILQNFSKYYKMLLKDEWSKIRQRWKELSDTIGKEVVIKLKKGEYRGLAIDIDENGGLMLKSKKIERVFSGECFYLR